MNTSTVIQASTTWVHAAPARGGAVSLRSGKPRKGLVGSEEYVGIISFPASEIAAAVNGQQLQAARLTLHRDAAYGTDARQLTIAPATGLQPGNVMTHDELIDLCRRGLAYTLTVSGEACVIDLPGAMLRELKQGRGESFMLYSGKDESGSDAILFTEDAQLELVTGSEWVQPVWTRPINTGDLVSHPDRSHISSLYELEYYINLRANIDQTATIDISQPVYDIGAFVTWESIIRYMRSAMDAIATAEGRTYSWKTLPEKCMPDAAAINELRNYLEADPVSATEYITLNDWRMAIGPMYYSEGGSKKTADSATSQWRTDWAYQEHLPKCGKEWGRDQDKKKFWYNYFCGWMLPDKAKASGVRTLKVQLTSGTTSDGGFRAQTHNWLCPIRMTAWPVGAVAFGDILERSNNIGEAEAAPGQTFTITLSDAFVQGLKGGTYGGIAFDCESARKIYTNATLIING